MGYGQHQSFYLRNGWLSKGFFGLSEDNRFFYDKFAFEKIGLGKNMVQSLRHWLLATRVVCEKTNNEHKKIYELTDLGKIIQEHDRYIRQNDTAAILHYNLVKTDEPSTTWFWFFNIFKETFINKADLYEHFKEWVNEKEKKVVSERSLKRDLECLINMYTANVNLQDPEEVIFSPLSKLGLIKDPNNYIQKISPEPEKIGLTALYYVLLDYANKVNRYDLAVEEILNAEGLWGKVFHLSRSSAIKVLSKFEELPKDKRIVFIRTNNIDTIRLPELQSIDFLNEAYKKSWWIKE